MSRRTEGFTLIEMLVVVALIAILAGLFLGPITAARRNANKTYCLNNVKEIARGTVLMFEELNGAFIESSGYGEFGENCEDVLPYVDDSFDVFNCPSQKDAEIFQSEGEIDLAFPNTPEVFTDYEINNMLVSMGAADKAVRCQRAITDPSAAAWVYDCKYGDPERTAHHGGANVGYLDGHGAWMPRELMNLEHPHENCRFFNWGHDSYELDPAHLGEDIPCAGQ